MNDECIENISSGFNFLCRSAIRNVADELSKGGKADRSRVKMRGFIATNEEDTRDVYKMKATTDRRDIEDNIYNMYSFHPPICIVIIRSLSISSKYCND